MTNAIDIQTEYIEELRNLLPELMAWWDGLLASRPAEDIWAIWPTGPAGHPQVLQIFRKYYFKVDVLNHQSEESFGGNPEKSPVDMWGIDDLGEAADIVRPVDLLIIEIPELAPNLQEIVDGICFVPIGETRSGDLF